VAADFFHVDTILFKRLYVLFFIVKGVIAHTCTLSGQDSHEEVGVG
jgi:hypothetical protein